MSLSQLENLNNFTVQEFDSAVSRHQPFVVHGAISHWPALQLWNPEYFERSYGDLIVVAGRYDPDEDSSYLDQTLADVNRTFPLREFLNGLESADNKLALREDTSLFEHVPELLDDLSNFSPFTIASSVEYKALWIGPPEYVTGLHTDPGPTLLFQIHGRKHVLLFAPNQTPFLYEEEFAVRHRKFDSSPLRTRLDPVEFSILKDQVRWSKVQPFDPDIRMFPLFTLVIGFEASIGPGDTLYIPDQWWHAVRSLETAISVSMEPDFSFLELNPTVTPPDSSRQNSA